MITVANHPLSGLDKGVFAVVLGQAKQRRLQIGASVFTLPGPEIIHRLLIDLTREGNKVWFKITKL